jgi:hypothetical protein
MDTKTQKQREDDLRKSLNYAYLKAGASQEAIDKFKTQATKLLNSIQTNESEEFHKNSLSDFLKDTYYKDKHYINVKDKKDLVIHNDKTANSSVGVIIEIKRPSNKSEMINCDNLNKKALQELVLYYLRERFSDKPNLHIKHLIVTNICEWFIFDARVFEQCFAENKQLVKDFADFESGTLAGHKTSSFYDDIAKPVIELCKEQLLFTYFNLADYQTLLENTDKEKDNALIPLFKILSPEHLLKLSFSNDANSLNEEFYNELLHIIGVEEVKENGKKLIKRKEKEKERHSASFLEQIICNVKNRGEITQEQPLFDVAIELCIIWINRILFLKLLEAQLMTYHKNDKLYQFFNIEKLTCFSDLNHLFFDVLAIKEESRDEDSKKRLCHIPYLNSSLFEEKKLEKETLDISKLRRLELPILSTTVLKNEQGYKLTGELDILSYLFSFLDAYDFSNDSKEEIKKHNKSLITASVLGLIFEKINGYKDGSFFTPSIITMYMSRETMRLAVLQKFNELKGWQCETFNDLKSKISNDTSELRKEANDIVNSIKVCDPAVGSGHFLVSVLNEFIAIKSELGILVYHDDKDYTGLSGWKITVDNDELDITLRNNNKIKFEYHIDDKDSQFIQKTLFHEKQKIIENCLFGVDINPNSVEICRLRLWIELLKNAYYKEDGKLETLPNIDINIKIGNSLISRFSLDADLKTALQRSNTNIEKYKEAFHSYQNAKSKPEKKEMDDLIESIKDNFRAEIYENNPNKKLLTEKIAAKYALSNTSLIEETEKEKLAKENSLQKVEFEITRLTNEIENFRNNPLYKNAFEWRFEFPEALNDNGDFIGFDVVIGNPPYLRVQGLDKSYKIEYENRFSSATGAFDLYTLFTENSLNFVRKKGVLNFIQPDKWINSSFGKGLRKVAAKHISKLISFKQHQVFHASTYSSLLWLKKETQQQLLYTELDKELINNSELQIWLNKLDSNSFNPIENASLSGKVWDFTMSKNNLIMEKLLENTQTLGNITRKIFQGIATSADKIYILEVVADKGDIIRCYSKQLEKEIYIEKSLTKPFLMGKDVHRYQTPVADNVVIFPYVFEDDKALLMTEREIEENYPLAWAYLLKNKKELELRENKKFLENWWCFSRPQNMTEFEVVKLMTPDISGKPEISIDESGKLYHTTTIYSFIFNEEADDSVKYYLGLLNSKVMWYFLTVTGNVLRGGFLRFKTEYLRRFPIPESTLEEREAIETLVDEVLTAKKTGQDTHDLEVQIDSLVYAIYGLSEAEIAIVEGKE